MLTGLSSSDPIDSCNICRMWSFKIRRNYAISINFCIRCVDIFRMTHLRRIVGQNIFLVKKRGKIHKPHGGFRKRELGQVGSVIIISFQLASMLSFNTFIIILL